MRAHKAGIETIAYQDDNILLSSRIWEDEGNRTRVASYVPPKVRILTGRLVLPRDANPLRWQPELLTLLKDLARVRYPGVEMRLAAM